MSPRAYTALLLFIAGLGGFLYGYDIGIIGAALLYLNKSIALSAAEESAVVAAVLAGGTVSSLVAGVMADAVGRRRLMLVAAALFIASVWLTVVAHGFAALFAGRTLQGLSAGMIAVVIPLYLAECLPPEIRGRGTAAFQLLLTIGILVSLAVGAHYTRGVETIAAAGGGIGPAQDAAWRAMFRSALYPALVFFGGAVFLAESPRWLWTRGRAEEARIALQRARGEAAANAELALMAEAAQRPGSGARPGADSLWQRRYVVPFVLTCLVLGLTQTTGINSLLQFVVVLLQKAGLSAAEAATRSTWVSAVNVLFTIVGLLLVDRLGRKPLLQIGTAGIALALVALAVTFRSLDAGDGATGTGANVATLAMIVFIASFAIGPGVCVWLALSELMPTRIRSIGMGLGLLINQGISTALAAAFLPVVRTFGHAPMFGFCAVCTVGYFVVVTRWLPETKGRTLEEIEALFDRRA